MGFVYEVVPPGLDALFAPSQQCFRNRQSYHVALGAIARWAGIRVFVVFRVVVVHPDDEGIKQVAVILTQSHVQKSRGGHLRCASGTIGWKGGAASAPVVVSTSRLRLCGGRTSKRSCSRAGTARRNVGTAPLSEGAPGGAPCKSYYSVVVLSAERAGHMAVREMAVEYASDAGGIVIRRVSSILGIIVVTWISVSVHRS